MGAATLLADLIARGITFASDGERLRVRGVLTDADRAAIRAHKAELLAALSQASPAQTAEEPRSAPIPALGIPLDAVLSPAEAEDRVERFDERAGIHEHDGELPRQQAEAQARQAVFQDRHPYYFRLAEAPEMSPVFITHAATVEKARQELAARFGQARVIAVWPVGKREGTP